MRDPPVVRADDDVLVAMYYADTPITTIEKRFDICGSTVYGRLRANYVFMNRSPRSAWSDVDDAKILWTRYNGGTGRDFEDIVPGRGYESIKDRLRTLIRGGHNAF